MKKNLDEASSTDLQEFAETHAKSWMDHLDWAIHRKRHASSDILILRYEDMKLDMVAQVVLMVDYLGLRISAEDISRAVEVQSLENRRSLAIRKNPTVHTYVIGEGETGLGEALFADILDAELVAKMSDKYHELSDLMR